MELQEKIRLILQEEGLSQKRFADKLGVSISYIHALTSGKRARVSNSLALLIEEKFGYNAKWLLNDEMPIRIDGTSKSVQQIFENMEKLSPSELDAVQSVINAFLKNK